MGAPFVIYICVFYTLFTASIILHFISSRVGCAEERVRREKEDADEGPVEGRREGEKESEKERGEGTEAKGRGMVGRVVSSSISPELPSVP